MPDSSLEPVADILLRRCRMVVVEQGPVSDVAKATLLAELFQMGYTVENPQQYSDSLLLRHQPLMEELAQLRGGGVSYVPLYSGFPEKVPEPDEYNLRRLLGYVLDAARWDVPGRQTENGMVVPEWLFNLELFSANPITQRQDWRLYLKQKLQQLTRKQEAPKRAVSLRFVPADEAVPRLQEWLKRCLTSKTSYPEGHRADFVRALELLPNFRLSPQEVAFREHSALYAGFLWTHREGEGLAGFCRYPTDLLRLLAVLTGGDVSLANKVKYPKISRSQRRRVLALLEGMGPIEVVEDQLFRYRGLWLALERSLHSGEYESLFPNACRLLSALRANTLRPRFSNLETAYSESDLQRVLSELKNLPAGVSLRRFSQTVALSGKLDGLGQLTDRMDKAALKDLLIVHSVLGRDAWATEALVLTKRGSSRVIPRDPARISEDTRRQAQGFFWSLICKKIEAKNRIESWESKKVFLHPQLRDFVVPTALRSASDSFLVLGRGSALDMGDGPTLRLFVYWKQRMLRTDVDLSALVLNDRLKVTQQVSWTNLKALGMVHSGDLQSAPFGAAEFIDADLATLKAAGHRYLAMFVLRFAGEHFSCMSCLCGWMMREKPNSDYSSFDISTVQQKLAMGGEVTCAIPVIFDLEHGRAIWTDLRFYGTSDGNALETAFSRVERALRVSLQAPRWKLNLYELGRLHAQARGASITDSVKEADIVFGLESPAHYHPGDWSRVLSELL